MNMPGFITLPLFHAHGLSSVFRSFTSYKKIFMYNASLPVTKDNLLQILNNYGSELEIFYGVPYALKLLSETEEGIQRLAQMKAVMFGGSACPDGLGDLLVENGVNLISHYGTTETGQLMTSFRPHDDKAWNYVRVHTALEPYVRFEARGGNLHELIVLEGWPSKVATNRDDDSYATKDLFEPHPSIDGAWKYGGRLDDTIVLMNGEKAIPMALEMTVRRKGLVKDVVVAGTGKSSLIMLVIASQVAQDLGREDVIAGIWPSIDAENKNSPSYAQISRDSIVVLPSSTIYTQTDKGTLIRAAFYKQFSSVIGDIYTKLEVTSSGTMVLDEADLKVWLRAQISDLSGLDMIDITDETDLFSLGMDSLQSSRLRSVLLKRLQLNRHPLPQNVVFEQPSITKLARKTIMIRDGAQEQAIAVEDEMSTLIEKYSTFTPHQPRKRQTSTQTVIVTGVTGSLGAHVVAQLLLNPDVTEVCCLVRASDTVSARRRVLRSMNDRSVLHGIPLDARRKIVVYPSDLSKPDLGLGQQVYDRLTETAVSIIHCAWSVNFNKRLSSFEADCIAGTHNLIQLCLDTQAPRPASFNFCSSVSTVVRTPGPIVPEALPASLASAQGLGYAQSKLVTEHIISRVAAQN
ncbi:hypothetical protein LTR66_017038, partial [Elasticomyces elasticus]